VIIVVLVAAIGIVVFITLFSVRHKWEQNELLYHELLRKKEPSDAAGSSKRRQTIQIIQMLKNLLIALFFLPLFSGCLKSSEITNTCNFDACSKKAPASEIQAIRIILRPIILPMPHSIAAVYFIR
jgi:hypothetical protein